MFWPLKFHYKWITLYILLIFVLKLCILDFCEPSLLNLLLKKLIFYTLLPLVRRWHIVLPIYNWIKDACFVQFFNSILYFIYLKNTKQTNKQTLHDVCLPNKDMLLSFRIFLWFFSFILNSHLLASVILS